MRIDVLRSLFASLRPSTTQAAKARTSRSPSAQESNFFMGEGCRPDVKPR